ncbi:MAG TPA: iron-containing alcohol dehydrogenase [Tepidisphaeraceae bacterium]|jgi:alcohol dehydrogenase class IV
MSGFEFHTVGRIIFGRGQFARAGELAAGLGRKSALIVFNGSQSAADQLVQQLAVANMRGVTSRQRGEPTVEDVDRMVEVARSNGCDMVIGLGGGSAIDAAKAVAGLLGNGGSALDYMEVVGKGQKITRPAAPWIAIPSTAGTGAEATRNAVIGYPPKQFKASLRSEHLLARIALVDPQLGVDVPPDVTARSGMDALCQCIESYTSNSAQPLTDALALDGVRRASRSLLRAFKDGSDLDAREDMALAALFSGIALANAGLGAVHGFAAPLGAGFPIPHGTACAALLPHVMAANVQALRQADTAHPVLARYASIGRILMDDPTKADEPAIEGGIGVVRRLCGDLRIPSLRPFGLDKDHVPAVSNLARKSSSMRYNPIQLSEEALNTILSEAL